MPALSTGVRGVRDVRGVRGVRDVIRVRGVRGANIISGSKGNWLPTLTVNQGPKGCEGSNPSASTGQIHTPPMT